ncbi:ubiquitin-related modifier 1 homolog isoform X1 [Ananas comosus]|uniref:Ubiquitin-related modifier 1 homolog n=1 Tax=Ananas comosus TaxID=4615 RepID=A0A6P5ERC7_ANACO|nr:ubiquitin-related modifier 1 homolog isoform X1 [Ananas comosus]
MKNRCRVVFNPANFCYPIRLPHSPFLSLSFLRVGGALNSNPRQHLQFLVIDRLKTISRCVSLSSSAVASSFSATPLRSITSMSTQNLETISAIQLIMRDLLSWIKSNLIKERPEMFMKAESVRPGVLVLINDCDWELCGNLDAVLEEKDVVVFISTLHGG